MHSISFLPVALLLSIGQVALSAEWEATVCKGVDRHLAAGDSQSDSRVADITNSETERDDCYLPFVKDPTIGTNGFDSVYDDCGGACDESAATNNNPTGKAVNDPIEICFEDCAGVCCAQVLGAHVKKDNLVDNNGQLSISPEYYLFSGAEEWTMEFNCSIIGFGFFGIDITDVEGGLSLHLEVDALESTEDGDEIKYIVNAEEDDLESGSVLWFSVVDEMNPVNKLTFKNTNGRTNGPEGLDGFAFDDFHILTDCNLEFCVGGIRGTGDNVNVCCCDSEVCGSEVCGGCDCAVTGFPQDCCPDSIKMDMVLCEWATECGCLLGPAVLPFGPDNGGDDECL